MIIKVYENNELTKTFTNEEDFNKWYDITIEKDPEYFRNNSVEVRIY